jgi:hypothetical protein
MSKQSDWTVCVDQMPPENVLVMTKIDDERGIRNEQALCFHSHLWWTRCGADAMYVYYTPTHWKFVEMQAHVREERR